MNKIILASRSPRRKQLMEQAELEFEILSADVEETYPESMSTLSVPEYLANKKANAITADKDTVVIAADTIVVLDGKILGKPTDEKNAKDTLRKLSGREHEVITGVCMKKGEKIISFSVTTEVLFRRLSDKQISHYVTNYKPMDKAGAYAIQEWIGLIGIKKIKGDYYNVMGLPIGKIVKRLRYLNIE